MMLTFVLIFVASIIFTLGFLLGVRAGIQDSLPLPTITDQDLLDSWWELSGRDRLFNAAVDGEWWA